MGKKINSLEAPREKKGTHEINLLACPDSAELTRAKQHLTETREALENRRQALRDLPASDARRAMYSARAESAESEERAALVEVLRLRQDVLSEHIYMCRTRYDLALKDAKETGERLAALMNQGGAISC
jgi:ribosomal protein L7/L12